MPDPGGFSRVLIIRLGALGDVIRTLPALRAIRHRLPRAEISWLVEESSRDLLEGHPDLDRVILLPRRRLSAELKRPWHLPRALGRLGGLARDLRNLKFDAVFDLHGLLKSGLLARASGAPVRYGFPAELCREGSHHFLTHPLPVPPQVKNRVERLFHMLEAAGIPPRPEAGAGIFPGRDDSASVTRFLEEQVPSAADGIRGLVTLSAGSSSLQSWKRWPAERFADTARVLTERFPAEVVLTWGPGERELAQAVQTMTASCRVHVAPPLRLMALADLLRRSTLFVGGDSGPMHLAASMGTAVVGIFGPTDPELNRPLAPGGFTAVQPVGDFSDLSKQERRRTVAIEEVECAAVIEAAGDAFHKVWSTGNERVTEGDTPKPSPGNDRPLLHAAVLGGPVEVQVLTHLLKEDGIPHHVRPFRETAFDGIFEPQKGHAELLVPEEMIERARALLESVRAGEGLDEASVEGADP